VGLLVTLSSMTGFARAQGALGSWRWTVEIKCVNAKGLDLRVRVPNGFDRVEAPARARLAKALSRGTVFANIARGRRAVRPRAADARRAARGARRGRGGRGA
jgi:uncharacterized protein YicC (UPF0701 family)